MQSLGTVEGFDVWDGGHSKCRTSACALDNGLGGGADSTDTATPFSGGYPPEVADGSIEAFLSPPGRLSFTEEFKQGAVAMLMDGLSGCMKQLA